MPQLIEWRDEFRTGIRAVDYEHEQLIALINELHDNRSLHGDKAAAEAVLGDILSGITAHFALEERVMRDIGYADLVAHKAEHEALLDSIRLIMEQVHHAPAFDYRAQLQSQLQHWFGDHFKGADAKLHRVTCR